MTEDNIKHYHALAVRWVAEADGDMLARDEASEVGWSVVAELTDDERADLLGWVREFMARKAKSMDHYPPTVRAAALFCAVAKTLEIGHFKAACLCEEAGWPS